MSYIDIGKKDGELIMGGSRVGEKGYFIEPTIFVNVPDESRINKEEVFGPVCVVHTFKTEEEVLRRANDTECSSPSLCTHPFPVSSLVASPSPLTYCVAGVLLTQCERQTDYTPQSSRKTSTELCASPKDSTPVSSV